MLSLKHKLTTLLSKWLEWIKRTEKYYQINIVFKSWSMKIMQLLVLYAFFLILLYNFDSFTYPVIVELDTPSLLKVQR